MIRLLTEQDRESVLEYLYQESAYNIFPIGDIETFGFDTDFQRVYAEFNEKGEYESILLYYRIHRIYYSHKTQFNLEYLKLLQEHPFDFMSGKEELMALIQPHFPEIKPKPTFFCKATSLENEVEYDESIIKKVSTKEDCSKLYDLLATVAEFGIHKQTKEDYIEGKLKSLQMGETYVIEEDGKFVSTVATTAETTINAMVIAVATHKEYRQKGYASILMTHLMKEYFDNKKKELCLFYDNPKAGKIYLRLGFKDFGKWVMMNKE